MSEVAEFIRGWLDVHFDESCECGTGDHCPLCVARLFIHRAPDVLAELTAAQARIETLTAALRGVGVEEDDGWCWCDGIANVQPVGQDHTTECKRARAALDGAPVEVSGE